MNLQEQLDAKLEGETPSQNSEDETKDEIETKMISEDFNLILSIESIGLGSVFFGGSQNLCKIFMGEDYPFHSLLIRYFYSTT